MSFISKKTKESITQCNSIASLKEVFKAICQDYLDTYPLAKKYSWFEKSHTRQGAATEIKEILNSHQMKKILNSYQMDEKIQISEKTSAKKAENTCDFFQGLLKKAGNGSLCITLSGAFNKFIENLKKNKTSLGEKEKILLEDHEARVNTTCERAGL